MNENDWKIWMPPVHFDLIIRRSIIEVQSQTTTKWPSTLTVSYWFFFAYSGFPIYHFPIHCLVKDQRMVFRNTQDLMNLMKQEYACATFYYTDEHAILKTFNAFRLNLWLSNFLVPGTLLILGSMPWIPI